MYHSPWINHLGTWGPGVWLKELIPVTSNKPHLGSRPLNPHFIVSLGACTCFRMAWCSFGSDTWSRCSSATGAGRNWYCVFDHANVPLDIGNILLGFKNLPLRSGYIPSKVKESLSPAILRCKYGVNHNCWIIIISLFNGSLRPCSVSESCAGEEFLSKTYMHRGTCVQRYNCCTAKRVVACVRPYMEDWWRILHTDYGFIQICTCSECHEI